MKVLFDQEVVVKIRFADIKLGVKFMKNEDVLVEKFEIKLYNENKLDFLFKSTLSQKLCDKIREENRIDDIEKFIVDFIKEMESKSNDWLQIKHNSVGTCYLEFMSIQAASCFPKSLLKLCLTRVSGDNLIQHLVSKAESFQTKWKKLNSNNGEMLIRLNNLVKEKKEIDKICKEQASKISSFTKEVENMKAEVKKLHGENQGLQDSAYELEDDMKHLNDHVQELADEVTFWKSKSEDYNLEVEVNIKQKERLEKENEKLERELHETQATLDEVVEVARKYAARLREFDDALDIQIEDEKTLAELNKYSETAVVKYQQLLDEAEEKKKNLKDNVQSLKVHLKKEMLDLLKNNDMKQLNFLLLPLEIQDMIVKEMVHNCPPNDWLNFAQTSQYSNWLVKRAHPKKIVDCLRIYFYEEDFDISIDSGIIHSKTLIEMLNFFRTCQIKWLYCMEMTFFSKNNSFWNSEFEEAFCQASKFVTYLNVRLPKEIGEGFMNFYKNLKCLNNLRMDKYISNVLHLPQLPVKLCLSPCKDENLENFLQNLAEKTKNFPLKSVRFTNEFTTDDMEQFLQIGTFFDDARLSFCVNSKNRGNFEKMIKLFGAERNFLGEFLLKKKVRIVPSDENENLNGIYIKLY